MTTEEAQEILTNGLEELGQHKDVRRTFKVCGKHIFNESDEIIETPIGQRFTQKENSDAIRRCYPNCYYFTVEATHKYNGTKIIEIWTINKETKMGEEALIER